MGLPEEATKDRVESCLGLLGIAHLRDRPHYHLSEGEKRKVALAAILSLNPDVLLLDEPMSGLDPRTKKSIKELMISLHEAGKTVICATHEFTSTDGCFERAIVFSEHHELVRTGPFDRIVKDTDFLRKHNIL
jgi:cobalt/nickel transport system ATP-binding protein